LKCGTEEKITKADIDEEYHKLKEAKSLIPISPNFISAYKYLKHQNMRCSFCEADISINRFKYVLPCYCTICAQCIEIPNGPIDIYLEHLKSKTPKEPFVLKCKKHNLPFSIHRLIDLCYKKRLNPTIQNMIALYYENCKFSI